MEEKKYPVFEEEESIGMCCEPTVSAYTATGSGSANMLAEPEKDLLQRPVERLGFYTEDPEEFEARIAEIETELERAEQGDETDWLTAEEFDLELKKEFSWLR
jgi:hypothetical protein